MPRSSGFASTWSFLTWLSLAFSACAPGPGRDRIETEPAQVPTQVSTTAPTVIPSRTPTFVIPQEESVSLPPLVEFDLTHIPAPIVRSGWTSFSSIRGVQDLAFDHAFNLWAATSGGAVVWREDGTYTQYMWEHGLATNAVQTVAVAADGSVWFGTYGGGVSRFDDQSWQTYTAKDGLGDDFIFSSAAAPDGSVWFGTLAGASRFFPDE